MDLDEMWRCGRYKNWIQALSYVVKLAYFTQISSFRPRNWRDFLIFLRDVGEIRFLARYWRDFYCSKIGILYRRDKKCGREEVWGFGREEVSEISC